MGNAIQVVSPQNAYIMTKIMEKTVTEGTLAYGSGVGSKLAYKDEKGNTYRIPLAGKTGTPQNWSDAWAVGYSPYYTSAVWFGFDKPGNSLGVELTGSTLCGPIWGDYMREIHKGKPRREFTRPASGIIDVTVCAKSGLLRTGECNEGAVTLPFLSGTQPGQYCDFHGGASPYQARIPVRSVQYGSYDDDFLFGSLSMPSLPLDLLPELANNSNNRQQGSRNTRNTANRNNQASTQLLSNPWLDDDVSITPDLQLELDEPEEAPEVIQEVVHIEAVVPVAQSEIELEEPAEEAIAADTADDDLPSWNPLE
jgi:penicillin-binding protein 1A